MTGIKCTVGSHAYGLIISNDDSSWEALSRMRPRYLGIVAVNDTDAHTSPVRTTYQYTKYVGTQAQMCLHGACRCVYGVVLPAKCRCMCKNYTHERQGQQSTTLKLIAGDNDYWGRACAVQVCSNADMQTRGRPTPPFAIKHPITLDVAAGVTRLGAGSRGTIV